MTTTRNENGETDNDNEGAERWCSTCEHIAEDCTCNPDGDETVAEYEAAEAAKANSDRRSTAKRCNRFGDMPSGLHVTEIENAYLNTAELQIKRAALIEGHEDSDLIDQVDAAIAKRIARPKSSLRFASQPGCPTAQIAKQYLNIDNIDTRNSDGLDFHDLAVWSLRGAIEAAYAAGLKARAQ